MSAEEDREIARLRKEADDLRAQLAASEAKSAQAKRVVEILEDAIAKLQAWQESGNTGPGPRGTQPPRGRG